MSLDGVLLGILGNYFRAAAEAAGYTLERTAYTTFISTVALMQSRRAEFKAMLRGLARTLGSPEHRARAVAICTDLEVPEAALS